MLLARHLTSNPCIKKFITPGTHRCASVLSSIPQTFDEQPQGPSSSRQRHNNQPIVTPASSPVTTPSNNAFHPDYIPKAVKARLTLDELKQVLETSKTLLNHLQSEYLEHQSLQDTINAMAKEQQELLKTLSQRFGVSDTANKDDDPSSEKK